MTLIVHSPEWHADRRGGIGASDAPIITGDAPWGDLLTLFAVKSGIIDEPDIGNQATDWGLRLEDVVAGWWSESEGKKVRRVNVRPRHPDYDWMRTSLDRRVVGERAVLEVKTRRYADEQWGPAHSAEIPAHYLVQCQHEMAVTGTDMCYVAVLFAGSDPRPYDVPRDEGLIADLIELELRFWQCVQDGAPPDALIRKQTPVIPLHDGEVEADETLALGIAGVHGLRAEIKERKGELDAAEDAVKTLLGPNTAARAGAYRATYRQQADRRSVAWELAAAAYRKRLAEVDPAFDADSIETLFTAVKPGNRPLLVSLKEEAMNVA